MKFGPPSSVLQKSIVSIIEVERITTHFLHHDIPKGLFLFALRDDVTSIFFHKACSAIAGRNARYDDRSNGTIDKISSSLHGSAMQENFPRANSEVDLGHDMWRYKESSFFSSSTSSSPPRTIPSPLLCPCELDYASKRIVACTTERKVIANERNVVKNYDTQLALENISEFRNFTDNVLCIFHWRT